MTSSLYQSNLISHILQQNNNFQSILFNQPINIFLIRVVLSHQGHIKLQHFSFLFMQLKIHILLTVIEPDCNYFTLLEIPSHYLFSVHYVSCVVETNGCVSVAAILSDQVCSVADAKTVNEIFLLHNIFMTQADHDIA